VYGTVQIIDDGEVNMIIIDSYAELFFLLSVCLSASLFAVFRRSIFVF